MVWNNLNPLKHLRYLISEQNFRRLLHYSQQTDQKQLTRHLPKTGLPVQASGYIVLTQTPDERMRLNIQIIHTYLVNYFNPSLMPWILATTLSC